MTTGSIYGVDVGVPYSKWPTEALRRLRNDIGRNGEPSEEQQRISDEVDTLLTSREGTGVDYGSDGTMHHPV